MLAAGIRMTTSLGQGVNNEPVDWSQESALGIHWDRMVQRWLRRRAARESQLGVLSPSLQFCPAILGCPRRPYPVPAAQLSRALLGKSSQHVVAPIFHVGPLRLHCVGSPLAAAKSLCWCEQSLSLKQKESRNDKIQTTATFSTGTSRRPNHLGISIHETVNHRISI